MGALANMVGKHSDRPGNISLFRKTITTSMHRSCLLRNFPSLSLYGISPKCGRVDQHGQRTSYLSTKCCPNLETLTNLMIKLLVIAQFHKSKFIGRYPEVWAYWPTWQGAFRLAGKRFNWPGNIPPNLENSNDFDPTKSCVLRNFLNLSL